MIKVCYYFKLGLNIEVSPYDFRLGPKSSNYQDNLRKQIENLYLQNNNTKIAILSHSMGCKHALFLLNQMSQEWKDTYIDLWISISPAYAGSPRILKFLATGDNNGLFYV